MKRKKEKIIESQDKNRNKYIIFTIDITEKNEFFRKFQIFFNFLLLHIFNDSYLQT